MNTAAWYGVLILMKFRLLFIKAVVFLMVFSGTGWGIENPVGPATVPPSSFRSGLVRSPNPIDTSGNLVVTGNIRGGRHFRGVVPYRASSDFRAPLGSSSLDSFLRRSAGSEDFGRYTGTFGPYYSQTRTVTTTTPGLYRVIRPPAINLGALPRLPKRQVLSTLEASRPFSRLRPMSMALQELEKVISSEVSSYSQAKKLLDEQRQVPSNAMKGIWESRAQMKEFRQDLEQVEKKAAELTKSSTDQDKSLRLRAVDTAKRNIPQLFELQRPTEQTSEDKEGFPFAGSDPILQKIARWEPSQTQKSAPGIAAINRKMGTQLDVYEQMKWEIDNLQKTLEQLATVKPVKETLRDDDDKEPSKQGPHFAGSTNAIKGVWKSPAISGKMRTQKSSQEKSFPLDKVSGVDLSARARAILGSHRTFASFSEDKFNQHIRAAEGYLKQGKYYRAADAYTLASIYKPEDPLAYAGKSHALFAAGEYMSSALFLSRALEIFPEYARFKIDIEAMVGDRDKLESRIVDVEQWLERSKAGELQFLLGYIYYQIGRLEKAKEAVNGAHEKMPEAASVVSLKKAIDDAVREPVLQVPKRKKERL